MDVCVVLCCERAQKFSPYRTVNTFHLGYKPNQLVLYKKRSMKNK
jgi:hypothetical protein